MRSLLSSSLLFLSLLASRAIKSEKSGSIQPEEVNNNSDLLDGEGSGSGGASIAGGAARALPSKIVLGYASWCQCDEKIVQAVKDGVNVVVWFNLNLKKDPATGKPHVESCTDLSCVGTIHKQLSALSLPTVHLMSIGGWNSPHPDISFSGEQWFHVWDSWNRKIAARPALGFPGFDGIDWDLEGNDDPNSRYNKLTEAELTLMGTMSQAAKRAGYHVAMAPAESYLSPATRDFSFSLNQKPNVNWHQDFNYHGRNAYAYALAKFGTYGKDSLPTFDLVMVQLYEGWSTANYFSTVSKKDPSSVIESLVALYSAGWDVEVPGNPGSRVTVPAKRLLIGLANGWAKEDDKFWFVEPNECGKAYANLEAKGINLRGYGFWSIGDEGKSGVMLAKGLNSFMQTR